MLERRGLCRPVGLGTRGGTLIALVDPCPTLRPAACRAGERCAFVEGTLRDGIFCPARDELAGRHDTVADASGGEKRCHLLALDVCDERVHEHALELAGDLESHALRVRIDDQQQAAAGS